MRDRTQSWKLLFLRRKKDRYYIHGIGRIQSFMIYTHTHLTECHNIYRNIFNIPLPGSTFDIFISYVKECLLVFRLFTVNIFGSKTCLLTEKLLFVPLNTGEDIWEKANEHPKRYTFLFAWICILLFGKFNVHDIIILQKFPYIMFSQQYVYLN